ncbi:MAG: glycosyltransferase family 2 protein [Thermodesulfobacteriota bacterium]
MDYTIGILTWNSHALIGPLLDSIAAHRGTRPGETIVVDNGSTDGTVGLIEGRYPWVRLVKNPANRGVAPARNQILRMAQGRYVLILDVDTLVLPGAVDTLIEVMDQHPEAAIGGPKLLYRDRRLQLSCRPFPSPLNILIEGTFLRDYFPNSRLVKDYTMEEWDHASLRPVDWMYGACLIIRRDALARIGLFDEGYFYLYEDMDLCLAAWRQGFSVLYIPQAEIIHFLERERRSVLSRTLLIHLRSILRFLAKYYLGGRLRRPLGRQT